MAPLPFRTATSLTGHPPPGQAATHKPATPHPKTPSQIHAPPIKGQETNAHQPNPHTQPEPLFPATTRSQNPEECGRCPGRNPPSVLGGIQLNGLPASQAGHRRRLFALSPRWDGRLTRARGVLSLQGITARHGRSRLCPEPGVSPCASRRRGPARWMEFPQAKGPAAARRLTDQDNRNSPAVKPFRAGASPQGPPEATGQTVSSAILEALHHRWARRTLLRQALQGPCPSQASC